MEVNKFSVFRSFYEIAKKLSDEQRSLFYESIFAYGFDGIEPSFDDVVLQVAWEGIKPNIDNSVNGTINGSKGGSKSPHIKGGDKPPVETTTKEIPSTGGVARGGTNRKEMDKEMDRDVDKEEELIDSLNKSINSSRTCKICDCEMIPSIKKIGGEFKPVWKCGFCGTEVSE